MISSLIHECMIYIVISISQYLFQSCARGVSVPHGSIVCKKKRSVLSGVREYALPSTSTQTPDWHRLRQNEPRKTTRSANSCASISRCSCSTTLGAPLRWQELPMQTVISMFRPSCMNAFLPEHSVLFYRYCNTDIAFCQPPASRLQALALAMLRQRCVLLLRAANFTDLHILSQTQAPKRVIL